MVEYWNNGTLEWWNDGAMERIDFATHAFRLTDSPVACAGAGEFFCDLRDFGVAHYEHMLII